MSYIERRISLKKKHSIQFSRYSPDIYTSQYIPSSKPIQIFIIILQSIQLDYNFRMLITPMFKKIGKLLIIFILNWILGRAFFSAIIQYYYERHSYMDFQGQYSFIFLAYILVFFITGITTKFIQYRQEEQLTIARNQISQSRVDFIISAILTVIIIFFQQNAAGKVQQSVTTLGSILDVSIIVIVGIFFSRIPNNDEINQRYGYPKNRLIVALFVTFGLLAIVNSIFHGQSRQSTLFGILQYSIAVISLGFLCDSIKKIRVERTSISTCRFSYQLSKYVILGLFPSMLITGELTSMVKFLFNNKIFFTNIFLLSLTIALEKIMLFKILGEYLPHTKHLMGYTLYLAFILFKYEALQLQMVIGMILLIIGIIYELHTSYKQTYHRLYLSGLDEYRPTVRVSEAPSIGPNQLISNVSQLIEKEPNKTTQIIMNN